MFALTAAWAASSPRPRFGRAGLILSAITLVHLLYLILLARAHYILDAKPITLGAVSVAPDDFIAGIKDLLPWNLPIVLAMVDAILAIFILRWSRLDHSAAARKRSGAAAAFLAIATILAAVALPIVSTLCWDRLDLAGKNHRFFQGRFPELGEAGVGRVRPALAGDVWVDAALSRAIRRQGGDLAGAFR